MRIGWVTGISWGVESLSMYIILDRCIVSDDTNAACVKLSAFNKDFLSLISLI